MSRPHVGGQSGFNQLETGWNSWSALGIPMDPFFTDINLRYRIFWLGGRRMIEWAGGVETASFNDETGDRSLFVGALPVVPAWGRETHDHHQIVSGFTDLGPEATGVYLEHSGSGTFRLGLSVVRGTGVRTIYLDNVRYECSDIEVPFSPDNPRALNHGANRGFHQVVRDWTDIPYIDTGGTQWNSGLPDCVYRIVDTGGRRYLEMRGQLVSDIGDRLHTNVHPVNTIQNFDEWTLVGADGVTPFQQLALCATFTGGLTKGYGVLGIAGDQLSIQPHGGSDATVFYLDGLRFHCRLR